MSEASWPESCRIVHLGGGARAINKPNSRQVSLYPGIFDNDIEIVLDKYSHLQAILKTKGLAVFGVEFYVHQDQINFLFPPDWRPFYFAGGWRGEDSIQAWSQLANAAHKQEKNLKFLDLAWRIKFQLETCSWRIFELSNSYHQELQSRCKSNDYEDGRKFETQNSLFIYINANSFFSEIGTLRDYLAEFIAKYVLSEFLPKDKNIRLMSTLISDLKKIPCPPHPVAKWLLQISNDENDYGWLAELSDYRDLVVHYAPLAYASKRSFLLARSVTVDNKEIPGIFFPLPPDPKEVKKLRSKGEVEDDSEEWLKKSFEYTPSADAIDALEYCYGAFGKMALLSAGLVQYAPYSPEPMRINASEVKIYRKGG